mgnify:CR=1 FL=1
MHYALHILSPVSAPWVAWVMLFLLLCAVVAEMVQSGVVLQAFSTIFAKVERSYGDVQQNPLEELIMNIFRIGTFAMALYLYAYRAGDFRFTTYLLVAAWVLGIDAVKLAAAALVNYTFRISKRFALISTHYNNLWTVICCGFYVALLFLLNIDNAVVTKWSLFALAVAAIVLVLIKWIRIFCTDVRSLLYIVLYILTLEVLPLLVLIAGAGYIVD